MKERLLKLLCVAGIILGSALVAVGVGIFVWIAHTDLAKTTGAVVGIVSLILLMLVFLATYTLAPLGLAILIFSIFCLIQLRSRHNPPRVDGRPRLMRRYLLIALSVALVLTGYRWIINWVSRHADYAEDCCHSVAESKDAGLFLYQLDATPGFLAVNGKQVPIAEAWVERRFDYDYFLVWFQYRKPKPGYSIVVKPAAVGIDIESQLRLANEKPGFGNRGGNGWLFHKTLDRLPDNILFIEHRETWPGTNLIQQIVMKRRDA